MSKSLLEQLPGIVAAGKRQAAQILEQLEGRNRVSLQTRELVIPSKDRGGFNFWGNDGADAADTPNRLSTAITCSRWPHSSLAMRARRACEARLI